MSTFFAGHSVPISLRKLPPLSLRCLDGSTRQLSVTSKLSHVIICFRNSHIWDIPPWLSATSGTRQFPSDPTIIFLFPQWRRHFHCIWSWRCKTWADGKPFQSVGAGYVDVVKWKDQMGILNEDLTNLFIDSDGSIAFCAQGPFMPQRTPPAIRAALAKFSS